VALIGSSRDLVKIAPDDRFGQSNALMYQVFSGKTPSVTFEDWQKLGRRSGDPTNPHCKKL
jgi:hypothetical protein